ncbi:hypothetical protein O181_039924 [Austropuccinia psidii MF-1]|uniref:Protein kinase domain-containing protein n=1 Tax=Austropuccinia psidii MF-1 TaxID=1389203 RepID=A0A9Q3DB89_9BASI|nr:hypothetical protein [Austropuccinia psidii MF-1]
MLAFHSNNNNQEPSSGIITKSSPSSPAFHHSSSKSFSSSFKQSSQVFNRRRAQSFLGTTTPPSNSISSSSPYIDQTFSNTSFHASQSAPLSSSNSSWWMIGWLKDHDLPQNSSSDFKKQSLFQNPLSPCYFQNRNLPSPIITHPIISSFSSKDTPPFRVLNPSQPPMSLQKDLTTTQTQLVPPFYFPHHHYPDLPSSNPESSSHSVLNHTNLSSSQKEYIDFPIPWSKPQDFAEMVRHTTKLQKSRDSITGRLIINQYMKGKELGRGVHGIVYIGKNMDKVIRTTSLPQNGVASDLRELSEQPHNQIQPSHLSRTWPINGHHDNSTALGLLTQEDYETVAIKVVRREPRGPKSLRRSQLQRQREHERRTIVALSSETSSSHSRKSGLTSPTNLNGFLSPDLSSTGGVTLLKDVDDKLKKEIAIMKRLRHPHIVQLKEVIDDAKSKKVFMILEFMEGGQVLWQDSTSQTPLMTVEQARKTFRQVLLGLEYLHYQGIIHRDIKPANLLWTADRETVKISDFGVSHISGVLKRSISTTNLSANLSHDQLRSVNSTDDKALRKTEGSPAFMAPELCCPVTLTPAATPPEKTSIDYFTQSSKLARNQSIKSINQKGKYPLKLTPSHRLISLPLSPNTFPKGQRPVVGKAIDIWALGVTLFCLLFGKTPFNAPNEYELFNVIWNEPILIPESMGIEAQPINFDPQNPNADRHFQRDSRELVDLLKKLLEKDPQKRITLEEVKIHPWVLNNLDNTQHWVHETAPVGGDTVYVTTEEVANFSRPRAILTIHKPLFSVKQSLHKAAIKLGLQRQSHKLSRLRSKSASSTSPSVCNSPHLSSPLPSVACLPSPHKSTISVKPSSVRPKMALDTSNLQFYRKIDTSPVSISSSYVGHNNTLIPSSRLNSRSGSGAFGTSSITNFTSPLRSSKLSLPQSRSSTPITSNPQFEDSLINSGLNQSLASLLSSDNILDSKSNQPDNLMTFSPLAGSSAPLHSLTFNHENLSSIHTNHPHMLLRPFRSSKPLRLEHRRSLPNSPASIQAIASPSHSSLIPPRNHSPAAVSEGNYSTKPTHSRRFLDAFIRVKQKFQRSHSRHHHKPSSITDITPLVTDALQSRDSVKVIDTTHIIDQDNYFTNELNQPGPSSEILTSDTEPSYDERLLKQEESDDEADEEEKMMMMRTLKEKNYLD